MSDTRVRHVSGTIRLHEEVSVLHRLESCHVSVRTINTMAYCYLNSNNGIGFLQTAHGDKDESLRPSKMAVPEKWLMAYASKYSYTIHVKPKILSWRVIGQQLFYITRCNTSHLCRGIPFYLLNLQCHHQLHLHCHGLKKLAPTPLASKQYKLQICNWNA